MSYNDRHSIGYAVSLALILIIFTVPWHATSDHSFISSGNNDVSQFCQLYPHKTSGFCFPHLTISNSKITIENESTADSSSSVRTEGASSKGTWVWLWQNYSASLQAIQEHPGALTVVSPNTYLLLDDGTFGINSNEARLCPQIHALGLRCIPLIQNDQANPAGINALLSSDSLQSEFIQNAVDEAINSNLDGYNLDFEPSSGVQNLAAQYGAFLTNFANAMHEHGKSLSVDIATFDRGALWNYSIEGKSSVDLVLTMVTYDSNYTNFENAIKAMLANVPLNKIAIGLLTSADDSTLTPRFEAIKASNIPWVMVWPSNEDFLPETYWQNLATFLRS
jgi:hypothetical protein